MEFLPEITIELKHDEISTTSLSTIYLVKFVKTCRCNLLP